MNIQLSLSARLVSNDKIPSPPKQSKQIKNSNSFVSPFTYSYGDRDASAPPLSASDT